MASHFLEIFIYIFTFLGLYFQVFLLLTYLGWRVHKDDTPGFADDAALPSVSIMVPCWNESKTVIGTVESLLASHYPADKLSVIIIDDGSTDDTWSVVQKYANNPRVILLHKENEGSKFAALNYGLRHVITDIVGCLDADSLVDAMAVRNSIEWFSRDDVYGVVPSMVIDRPQSIMQYMQKVEYEIATYLKNVLHQVESLYVAPGPLTLFRADVFKQLGPYREAHHTEDLEIALRMQIAGMRLVHAADSLVYTKGPRTWPLLLKQRIRWTYGFIKNMQDYRAYLFSPTLGDLSFFILPFSVVTLGSALFVFGFVIYQAIESFVRLIQKIVLVGIHIPTGLPVIDIFTIPSASFTALSLIGISFLLAGLVIGRRIILKQKLLSFDLLTLLIYPYFSFWWTFRSVYNAVLSKKSSWR